MERIRMAGGFAGAVLFGRRIPLHVSWVVTNRCNLRCVYCGRPQNAGPELDTEQALLLVDMLAREGCLRLSLTGGEPLVREDLPLVMARARRHGIRMNINTNGLLIPDRPEAVRLADRIVISSDGPPEINDRLRGRGSFAGALAGAMKAKSAGLPVTYYTVIGASNLPHLDFLVGLAEENGARIFFQPGSMELLGSGEGINEDAPDRDEYRRGVEGLIEWKRRGRPIGNSLAGLRFIKRWPEPNPVKCWGGRLFARIDPDGHLRPCGRVERGPDNFVFGPGGVGGAMARMPVPDCTGCYSAARAEVNLMAGGDPGAVWNFLKGS